MNTKLVTIVGFVLGTLTVISLGAIAVGMYTKPTPPYQAGAMHRDISRGSQRGEMRDRMQAVKDMDPSDYKTYEEWKSAITQDGREPRVLEAIDSQEKFEKFVEMKKLMQDGKLTEANQIREELGLERGPRR